VATPAGPDALAVPDYYYPLTVTINSGKNTPGLLVTSSALLDGTKEVAPKFF